MATSADVPGKYDLVVNGQGFLLLDALAPNIPFRSHRAICTYSPTFLERTNVTGAWGDNQQAFWLTFSQNDWSGGEGLRFARPNDQTKANRYWLGSAVDPSVSGQITPARASNTVSFSSAVYGLVGGAGSNFYTASTTNLYEIDDTGSVTDRGAHGAGNVEIKQPLAYDGRYVYIAGASKIRRFDTGAHTFADFSSTVAESLAFLNNTLYGMVNGTLYSYSTSGTATTAYQWKDGTGTADTSSAVVRMCPYGGKLAILNSYSLGSAMHPEVFLYDGTGASRIAGFPDTFKAIDMCVADEILVVIGIEEGYGNNNRMAIYYYANGSIGVLSRDTVYTNNSVAGGIAVGAASSGFFYADAGRGLIRFYDLSQGAVWSVASYTPAGTDSGSIAATWSGQVMHVQHGHTTAVQVYHPTAETSVSGTVTSSLIDFDSSLTKYVKGVTADFTGTGTVGLAYQLNDLDGSWTTVTSSATSGTEYAIGQSCRSVGIKVTLNNGGLDVNKPVLKRLYVRAVPVLQTFRKREYILDLTGAAPTAPRRCRDGSAYPLAPFDGVTGLVTAAQSTTPISITDRLGTFTGIIEPDEFEVYEMHAEQEVPSKSGSYVVKLTVREV